MASYHIVTGSRGSPSRFALVFALNVDERECFLVVISAFSLYSQLLPPMTRFVCSQRPSSVLCCSIDFAFRLFLTKLTACRSWWRALFSCSLTHGCSVSVFNNELSPPLPLVPSPPVLPVHVFSFPPVNLRHVTLWACPEMTRDSLYNKELSLSLRPRACPWRDVRLAT